MMVWKFSVSEFIELVQDVPFPCSKEELIGFVERNGFSRAVIENLKELEDDGEEYQDPFDIWPNMPTLDDEIEWEEYMN